MGLLIINSTMPICAPKNGVNTIQKMASNT